MSNPGGATRDLSQLPPGSLAVRLAQALAERRGEQGPDDLSLSSMPYRVKRIGRPMVPPTAIDPNTPLVLTPEALAQAFSPAHVDMDDLPLTAPSLDDSDDPETSDEFQRLSLPPHTSDESAQPTDSTPADVLDHSAPSASWAIDEGADLRQELDDAHSEVAMLRKQMQQAQSDIMAVRRRSEREVAEAAGAATGELIGRIIPIVDDLERALLHLPDALRENTWAAGVLMIGDRLRTMLENEGVERLSPLHRPFDPNLHEAVARVQTDELPEDTITNVLLPGYILDGRVLRAAQVQVAVRKDQ